MAPVSSKNTAKRSSHRLFLGVDGGGTKTQIAIMNESRKVLAEAVSGPSNPLRVGVETAVTNIVQAVNEACDRGGLSRGDIFAATLGLAGVRRADLKQRVLDSFAGRVGLRKTVVVTDAEIALYGTTLGQPGLVVIAGTGSICLGKNAAGELAISGGWGPLAGDEGGGTGIALQALHMVAKASDGRGKPTALSASAAEYFRASGPENLIVAIYSPQIDNSRIAGFARLVVEAAAGGDKTAKQIITDAGRELGIAAGAVITKLKIAKLKIPIGCVGSVFTAGRMLTSPLLSTVRTVAPAAYLRQPTLLPAHAAARMAFDRSQNGNSNHH